MNQEQQEYLVQSAKQRAALAAIIANIMTLEGELTLQEIKHHVSNAYTRISMQGYLVYDEIDNEVMKVFQEWAAGEVAMEELKEILS